MLAGDAAGEHAARGGLDVDDRRRVRLGVHDRAEERAPSECATHVGLELDGPHLVHLAQLREERLPRERAADLRLQRHGEARLGARALRRIAACALFGQCLQPCLDGGGLGMGGGEFGRVQLRLALALQLVREFRAAGLDDAAIGQHVDHVRLDEIEQALVVGDDDEGAIRRAQRGSTNLSSANRIIMYVWPPIDASSDDLATIADHIRGTTADVGLEEVQLIARRRDRETGELRKVSIRFSVNATGGFDVSVGEPSTDPIEPVDEYRQKVLRAAKRNTVYPYELAAILGDFTEYDLDADDTIELKIDRPDRRDQ